MPKPESTTSNALAGSGTKIPTAFAPPRAATAESDKVLSVNATPFTSSGGEAFNVAVPAGDASFDPFNTGTAVITLTRSDFNEMTGTAAPDVTEKSHKIIYSQRPQRR
jgi:hypothetical protein